MTSTEPVYAEGRTLRKVLRKHSVAARKRIRKILKQKIRARMEAAAA